MGVDGGTSGSPATIPAIGGPITLVYTDAVTSGTATDVSRVTTLTIDVTPPTATISTPLSGSETQNRLPTFAGNVTDNQSGIDISTFALYIDQSIDGSTNDTLVIGAGNTASPPAISNDAASIDLGTLSDGINTLSFSHSPPVAIPTDVTANPDHIVDFQIQVADLAGNFGYSDSDTALGNIENSGRHGNQPHTIKIDQIIPQISTVATGLG
ncbi:MAG: hypothetical protein IIB03_10475, partial [Acidobacteria bacterium]|nr:hypothetical protein [Acidobacteriota bacterium]